MNSARFSARINKLFDEKNWSKARTAIAKELSSLPDDHWLLDRLSVTYYEEKNYQRALEIVKKAYELAPDCPLVLWDYAGTLDALGNSRAAVKLYKRMLKMYADGQDYEECWESPSWSASLALDTHYRLGVSYQKLNQLKKAKSFLCEFLRIRSENGIPSIYSLSQAKKLLKRMDLEKASVSSAPV